MMSCCSVCIGWRMHRRTTSSLVAISHMSSFFLLLASPLLLLCLLSPIFDFFSMIVLNGACMSIDIVIMVTLSQCIIFGSHIPQGAPSSDSMSADLTNKRNNPAEEFGEEEQDCDVHIWGFLFVNFVASICTATVHVGYIIEKNTFILIGMETLVRIECIISNQLLCMVSGHACLFL
uniref:Transmembrane protein n=1 Tax=Triticum urartu TaxID=4572 RepID=A0A8R7UJ31_TRIUA